MPLTLLLISAALNAAGSILLKFAFQKVPALTLAQLTNPYLYAALICFAANIVGYALLLRRVPLALGYPAYLGITLLIVLLASYVIFAERIGVVQYLGIALIALGAVLVVR